MNTTLKTAGHRVRQARKVAVRAELAMTSAQILFWLAVIGVVAGVAVGARRRLSHRKPPTRADVATEAPMPTE